MITVTISINNSPIYTRTCVNIGNLTPGGDPDKLRDWCRYQCDDGSEIIHDSKEGAVKLAHLMLDTIHEVK